MSLWEESPLSADLKAELGREYQRLKLVEEQIHTLETVQAERLQEAETEALKQVAQLMSLCGIGQSSAWVFVMEFFGWRGFRQRREVGA